MAGPMIDDVLSSYLRYVWTDGGVSVTNVLAGRTWLDIMAMNAYAPPTERLLSTEAQQVQNTFQFSIDATGVMVGGGTRWLGKDTDILNGISMLKRSIEAPMFHVLKQRMIAENPEQAPLDINDPNMEPKMKEAIIAHKRTLFPDGHGMKPEHEENANRLNIKMMRPHEDNSFLEHSNPFSAGTVMLDLALRTEEAGTNLANHHMSSFAVAHLYNALRQHRLIELAWPAMERAMERQIDPIFAGSIPSTPQAMYSHMELRVGFKGNSKLFNKKEPWKLQPCGAGVSLRQLVSGEGSRLHVSHVIHDRWLEDLDPKSKHNGTPRRHLSLNRFFAEFSDVLPQLIHDM